MVQSHDQMYKMDLDNSKNVGGITTLLSLGVFYSGIIFSCVIMLLSGESLWIKFSAYLILASFAVASVGFDIRHPLFWFAAGMLAYSLASPVLYALGVHPYQTYVGQRIGTFDFEKAVNVAFVGLLCGTVFISPVKRSFRITSYKLLPTLKTGNYILFVTTFALCVGHIAYVVLGGYTGKGEVALSSNPLAGASFAFNILILSSAVFLIDYCRRKKNRKFLVFSGLMSAFFLFTVLLIGHRNIFYRLLVTATFVPLVFVNKIKLKHVTIVVILLLLAMSISGVLGNLKMALLRGSNQEIEIKSQQTFGESKYQDLTKWHGIRQVFLLQSITNILGSEFMTAGNVLTVLLEHVPETYPYLLGKSILWDLKRAVVPGFLFNRDVETTAVFFVKRIWPETYLRGEGPGFSLVGFGYVNFGIIGVIVVFSIYGYAIKKLYLWATHSLVGSIFYVTFIPIGVLTLRNDISAPISQALKHIALPMLVMFIIGTELRRLGKTRHSGATNKLRIEAKYDRQNEKSIWNGELGD